MRNKPENGWCSVYVRRSEAEGWAGLQNERGNISITLSKGPLLYDDKTAQMIEELVQKIDVNATIETVPFCEN